MGIQILSSRVQTSSPAHKYDQLLWSFHFSKLIIVVFWAICPIKPRSSFQIRRGTACRCVKCAILCLWIVCNEWTLHKWMAILRLLYFQESFSFICFMTQWILRGAHISLKMSLRINDISCFKGKSSCLNWTCKNWHWHMVFAWKIKPLSTSGKLKRLHCIALHCLVRLSSPLQMSIVWTESVLFKLDKNNWIEQSSIIRNPLWFLQLQWSILKARISPIQYITDW